MPSCNESTPLLWSPIKRLCSPRHRGEQRCRRKEESMELCGALAFVPLCLLLTACDSGLIPSSTKALTRSRATELILKGTHPQTIYTWVQTGNILIYGDYDS